MHHVDGHIWRSFGSSEWQEGFYFADETSDFVGPYESQEKAQLALKEYCREQLGVHL